MDSISVGVALTDVNGNRVTVTHFKFFLKVNGGNVPHLIHILAQNGLLYNFSFTRQFVQKAAKPTRRRRQQVLQ